MHRWDAVWEAAGVLCAAHCFYQLLREDTRAASLGAKHWAEPALGGDACCQLQADVTPGARGVRPTGPAWKPFLTICALSGIHLNRWFSVNIPAPDGNQPDTSKQVFLFHSDSGLYEFTELWLLGFRKMNTSMIHQTGKEGENNQQTDTGQWVMNRAIAQFEKKPLRALTSVCWVQTAARQHWQTCQSALVVPDPQDTFCAAHSNSCHAAVTTHWKL